MNIVTNYEADLDAALDNMNLIIEILLQLHYSINRQFLKIEIDHFVIYILLLIVNDYNKIIYFTETLK